MEKAIKEMRDKVARNLYDCNYDELLTNHKDCVNGILKHDLVYMIDKYAYATIL